jgi:hypothetical protein
MLTLLGWQDLVCSQTGFDPAQQIFNTLTQG